MKTKLHNNTIFSPPQSPLSDHQNSFVIFCQFYCHLNYFFQLLKKGKIKNLKLFHFRKNIKKSIKIKFINRSDCTKASVRNQTKRIKFCGFIFAWCWFSIDDNFFFVFGSDWLFGRIQRRKKNCGNVWVEDWKMSEMVVMIIEVNLKE